MQLKEQGSEVQFVILIDSGNFSNLTFTNIDSEDEVDFKLKKHILSEAEMGILLQMEKSKQLALKYTPSYYDGRVVLLKAYSKDKNYKEIVMEYDNGWNSVLKNALEIYSIEGKHEQLLDAYHLPIVAQKIKNIIETPIPAILINPKLKTIDKHFLHATLLGDEYLIGKLLEAREQVSINSQT